jgi:hypothetical protein
MKQSRVPKISTSGGLKPPMIQPFQVSVPAQTQARTQPTAARSNEITKIIATSAARTPRASWPVLPVRSATASATSATTTGIPSPVASRRPARMTLQCRTRPNAGRSGN